MARRIGHVARARASILEARAVHLTQPDVVPTGGGPAVGRSPRADATDPRSRPRRRRDLSSRRPAGATTRRDAGAGTGGRAVARTRPSPRALRECPCGDRASSSACPQGILMSSPAGAASRPRASAGAPAARLRDPRSSPRRGLRRIRGVVVASPRCPIRGGVSPGHRAGPRRPRVSDRRFRGEVCAPLRPRGRRRGVTATARVAAPLVERPVETRAAAPGSRARRARTPRAPRGRAAAWRRCAL